MPFFTQSPRVAPSHEQHLELDHSLPHGPPTCPATSRTMPDPCRVPSYKTDSGLQTVVGPSPYKPPTSSVEMNSSRERAALDFADDPWLNPFVLPTDKGSLAPERRGGLWIISRPRLPTKPPDARCRCSPPHLRLPTREPHIAWRGAGMTQLAIASGCPCATAS